MPAEPNNPSPQPLERKLATILSADVAEYSRLMSEDEEQTLKIFRGHTQVFESLVAMHRGRIFNTAGDAILAEFGSAVEALRCATEIQAALRTRNDQLPPNRQVRFRIGVNLGDVMVHGQDLLGDGVNVAARLQSAAEPGGICISGSVHDQIRNKLSLSFKSLGDKSFKNIPQPVRTFSVTEAEGLGALPSPNSGAQNSMGKWMVAAALLVVVAGGYWAYSYMQRSKAPQVPISAIASNQETPSPQPKSAAEKPATPTAQPPAVETAKQQAKPAQPTEPAATLQAKSQPASPTVAASAQQSHAAAPAAAPAAPLPSAAADGVYSGKICYGLGQKDQARCFNEQGTVRDGKISGEWHGRGKEQDLTMFLEGTVSPSGEVQIHMHSQGGASPRLTQIDMTGTLHDGLLDATGSFRNGRSATLTWRKTPAPSH